VQSTLWPKPTGMKRVGSKIYSVDLVNREESRLEDEDVGGENPWDFPPSCRYL